MKDAHMTNDDLLSDKMQINLDVLCLLMVNRICGEVDNTNIITIHKGALKFLQQLTQLENFGHCVSHDPIFSFGA
jgi:hypothetical protein